MAAQKPLLAAARAVAEPTPPTDTQKGAEIIKSVGVQLQIAIPRLRFRGV